MKRLFDIIAVVFLIAILIVFERLGLLDEDGLEGGEV